MRRVHTRPSPPTVLAYLPDLHCYVLRRAGSLELWMVAPTCSRGTIWMGDHELEYIRPVIHVYRITDCEQNKVSCPDRIGQVILDVPPTGAHVTEVA